MVWFICHVNCNVNNCTLIHQSKIQIWEDWKCYRTHTCKVYCTSLSSSDQVAKGFFDTRTSHICRFSWIYLLLSLGKNTKEHYSYGQKIMHAGIWNVHFLCRTFWVSHPNCPPLPHQGKPLASDHYWVLYSLSECLGWVGAEFKPQVTSLTASYHQVVQ